MKDVPLSDEYRRDHPGHEGEELEAIIDERLDSQQRRILLVKWKEFGFEEATWELEAWQIRKKQLDSIEGSSDHEVFQQQVMVPIDIVAATSSLRLEEILPPDLRPSLSQNAPFRPSGHPDSPLSSAAITKSGNGAQSRTPLADAPFQQCGQKSLGQRLRAIMIMSDFDSVQTERARKTLTMAANMAHTKAGRSTGVTPCALIPHPDQRPG